MNKFTSFLAPLMEAYVFYQKASDHWNEASYEPNLVLYDRYCTITRNTKASRGVLLLEEF